MRPKTLQLLNKYPTITSYSTSTVALGTFACAHSCLSDRNSVIAPLLLLSCSGAAARAHIGTDALFMSPPYIVVVIALSVVQLSACAGFLPTIGPSRAQIDSAKTNAAAIQIIDIDDAVTRKLLEQRGSRMFSETLGNKRIASRTVGAGDVLEVSIWEAAPATLFSTATVTSSNVIGTSRPTTLP